ncbi:elongation factor G [Aquabacterium sp. OR-4]|uniref:elongation factor G n=1 Tax=Aquabacterium sp. OR-4 TaxID=2978127 RepID=UPI0021B4AC55|nr:elongation factor G [Aquabacterium sp. OR-4]MDT7834293.1 elongation factor G [Aquabacterium sp. OR-4]
MPSPQSAGAVPVHAIRTLALVGPAAAGKTTLAEQLLLASGAIASAGSLERGSTVSDFDPLERRLQHSLNSAVMHTRWRDSRIHFIDTPGAADFVGQSLPPIEAVETAAVVISAVNGIEPMAVRMMQYAADRGLDRLIIVNKIDAQGVDLAGLLAQIQATFGKECLPLNLPDAGGSQVVDCFFARSGHSDFGSVEAAHRALVEQVVEVDAAFVERYLNDGDIDATELHAPLEQALREGHLIPVCFVSARTGAGVGELLDIIDRLLPHPGEGNPPDFLRGEGDAAVRMHATPDPALHVLAHVFKVTVDPYVGKLGVMRVHQGSITPGTLLYVGDARKPFKVQHLYMLQGKEHVEVPRAVPGDICAIAKVDELHYDAVLHDAAEDDHIHLAPLALPRPVHGLAIAPKRRGDEQRMWEILAKLVDEDPCLRVEQDAGTHESVVYGLGELHLRILLERLRELHRFEVETQPPRVAYRETVTASAEGHYRHKKQTGGAGQFGEVYLRVEPLPRGAGFEFVDAVKGGTIPGQFMPAVEKGVREVLALGAISGHPVVDVRVVVYDGKHHSVDSKEIAFVTAARMAFLGAVREARPVVLEPIVEVEIQAPTPAIGDITGDLSARRGHVVGTSGAGSGGAAGPGVTGLSLVRGLAPLAELTSYQNRLNALTSGQGRFALALSHYEPAPPAVQQQLMAAWRPAEDH